MLLRPGVVALWRFRQFWGFWTWLLNSEFASGDRIGSSGGGDVRLQMEAMRGRVLAVKLNMSGSVAVFGPGRAWICRHFRSCNNLALRDRHFRRHARRNRPHLVCCEPRRPDGILQDVDRGVVVRVKRHANPDRCHRSVRHAPFRS